MVGEVQKGRCEEWNSEELREARKVVGLLVMLG